MKKVLNVMIVVMLLASAAAFAADSDNWSVKLSFSTDNAADVMEVTIGEGTASEMLKPPPLPGKVVTDDPSNAIVNAYAYMRSTQREVAKSILEPSEDIATIWEIQVEAEEEDAVVYLTPDLTGKDPSTKIKYLIIDGDTGSKKNLVNDLVGGKVEVYTSDGTAKTLYAMVGSSESFAIAKSDGSVIGNVEKSVDGITDQSGIEVYVDGGGSPTTTTLADGSFTLSGLSQGVHTITLDAQYTLPSTITGLEVLPDGTDAVPTTDLRRCDLDDDNIECGFKDLKKLKTAYDAVKGELDEYGKDRYTEAADTNGDGVIDFSDLKVLKRNYGDRVE